MTTRQETYDRVNELLPAAEPQGAYAMGLACAACWNVGVEPDASLLAELRAIDTLPHASRVVELYIAVHARAREGGMLL